MAKLLIMEVLVMLGTMATFTFTDAQPACASKLTPCFPFLNNATAKPTDDCCNPIKDAVAHDLACLCNLYSDPTLFASLNINITDALRLSRECGVTTDLTSCNATSPTSAPPPPGVAGGDNGGTDRVALTGITTFLLVLLSMTVLLY